MRISKGMQMANLILMEAINGDGKDIKSLAIEIADLLKKHQDPNQQKLKEDEKFLVGLMYSEFYADGSSDEEYIKASHKRNKFLKMLNIDAMELYNETEKIYGRSTN